MVRWHKVLTWLAVSVFMVGALSGRMASAQPPKHGLPKLGLLIPHTYVYQCQNGAKVPVSYYNLTDNSLSFIKIVLNGTVYTLPQVVSASGTRYTDLQRFEWFAKGDTALLTLNIHQTKLRAIECKQKATDGKLTPIK